MYFRWIHHHRLFCSKVDPSLQAQERRLQFCRRQVFHSKLRNRGCNFTRVWIGAVVSRCFPYPTRSFASEKTLKIWKDNSGSAWRWGERIWLIGPSGLHRNSPQRLNWSSIRFFFTRSEIRKYQSSFSSYGKLSTFNFWKNGRERLMTLTSYYIVGRTSVFEIIHVFFCNWSCFMRDLCKNFEPRLDCPPFL